MKKYFSKKFSVVAFSLIIVFLLSATSAEAISLIAGRMKTKITIKKCPSLWEIEGPFGGVVYGPLMSGAWITGGWIIGIGQKVRCGKSDVIAIIIAGASIPMIEMPFQTPPFSPKDFLKSKFQFDPNLMGK